MKNTTLTETNYVMSKECYYGTIFAQSNGYLGVRGSLEENGSLSVQGAYIRGVIDDIPFNQPVKIDSEYMRKFYINENEAKDAEFQEGVINFADILFFRIEVDGEVFYPWEGKIISWERTLDIESNVLKRCVVWENTHGDAVELTFERFASFSNDHIFCQKVHVKSINHNKKIRILSGVDLRTKSNGFKMCSVKSSEFDGNYIKIVLETKGKYCHKVNLLIKNSFKQVENVDDGGFVYQTTEKTGEFTVEKLIYISTSRDEIYDENYFGADKLSSYDKHFVTHKMEWTDFFEKMNIEIDGDDELDRNIRFCTYHTAISIARNDSVHSLGAKNLTGEAYNNYVWWDCEVYQMPIFLYSGSADVRNLLKYRYDRLDEAKKIAREENRRGARYPFISSVTGEEKVWRHVRHPFMQVHVVADVAWSIINYYNATGDNEYIKNYGLETLTQITEYWVSRVEEKNGRLEICGVTGCDEHHPYVDNNAYTNYLVKYIIDNTIELCEKFGRKIETEWKKTAEKLYIPIDKNGMIAQFDGYFDLSPSLECEGGGNFGFEMKTVGGQYHRSQIIKQPDVMVLFSYLDFDFEKDVYEKNWDYYRNMCESSSSLTYPVHAICAFDNNQLYSGYKYLKCCAEIDIADLHGGVDEGIHAGCSAGAWYAVVRGIAGVHIRKNGLFINPKMIPKWRMVKLSFCYRGARIQMKINAEHFLLCADKTINAIIYEKDTILEKDKEYLFEFL